MLPPRLLNGITRSYTIECLIPTPSVEKDLAQMPNSRKIMRFVLPTWQRDEVWSLSQKVAYVEGIFLGFGAGFLVVNGRGWIGASGAPAPMSGWLVDGQQRVSAVRDFLNGTYPIFGSIYWSDISRSEQMSRFLTQPFPHLEIQYIGDETTLKDLYKRLNRGGSTHTDEDMERLGHLATVQD